MAYQITATEGANAVNGVLLRIKVLTNAASTQNGATKTADTGTTPFYDQSIITTQAGSVVYGAMADGNTAFSMTADARTTLIDNFSDNTQGCQYATFRATAATGTPGATTLGATSPGGGEHGTYAAAEILAAGTLTEDASAPVVATTTTATSVQSAAFTPPAGSLLVAMVSHCSGGVSSITLSTSGGTLTWVQRAYLSTSGGTGAGVWVAQVPAAAPPGASVTPAPGWIPGGPGMPAGPAFTPWPPLPLVAPSLPAAPPLPGTPPPLPLPPAYPGPGLPGMPGGQAFAQYPLPPDMAPAPTPPSVDYIAGLAGSGAASYFADEHGNPRMVLGDAVWGLPGNAGRWSSGNWQGDFDTYFTTRQSQGFTAAYTKPMGTTQNGGINDDGRVFDGLFPFQGGSLANPSTGLTSSYWARIDYMLNSALAHGITVFLNAIGYDSDFEASGPLAGKSSTEFQSYGSQLGARYASQVNLVWVVADDYFGGATDTKISAFLTGLRGAGANQPISIENYPETTSRRDDSASASLAWGAANAQYNWAYSYNATYFMIEKSYAEASPICTIQGDGYFYQGGSSYAGGSGAFSYDRAIRQDAWHAISSGARGIIHGDEGCWQWASTAQAQASSAWYYSHNAGNIRTLMESLPNWHLLTPDSSSQLVTAGRGTHATGFSSGGGGGQYEVAYTDSYVTASRTPSGDLAVIYLSHATTITVDQTKMTAGYAAYWVDPITGVKTLTTSGSSYNSGSQGNNSQGDPDWVLVLQGVPGQPAGAASGTGSAPAVSLAALVAAAVALATGSAPAAGVAVSAQVGLAAATGSAPGVTLTTITPVTVVLSAAGTNSFTGPPCGGALDRVTCIGSSSGAGGALALANSAGGGSGGGGIGIRTNVPITEGASYSPVVGTGGTAGPGTGNAFGGQGTDTVFTGDAGVTVTGKASSPGQCTSANGPGGVGGVVSGDPVTFAGGAGHDGSATRGGSGGGSAGSAGAGGAATGTNGGTAGPGSDPGAVGQDGPASANTAGTDGVAPGGGASGAQGGSSVRIGGKGAPGVIIIVYTPRATPHAGLAAGTGSAPSLTAAASVAVPAVTGTGSAPNASVTAPVSAPVGLAAGTGSAPSPVAVAAVLAAAGLAAGDGTAPAAVAALARSVAAGLATATGSAPSLTLAASAAAGPAAGAGSAPALTLAASVAAGLAAATGTAAGPGPAAALAAPAGLAAGTGTAPSPSVSAAGSVNVTAGLAAGTGIAPAPAALAASSPAAGLAAAGGSAPALALAASVAAGAAAGTGSAPAPVAAPASPRAAGLAAGTGTALAATASTASAASASAGLAGGTGTAPSPDAALARSVAAGLAAASAYAGPATLAAGVSAALAAGLGAAPGPGLILAAHPPVALAAGLGVALGAAGQPAKFLTAALAPAAGTAAGAAVTLAAFPPVPAATAAGAALTPAWLSRQAVSYGTAVAGGGPLVAASTSGAAFPGASAGGAGSPAQSTTSGSP